MMPLCINNSKKNASESPIKSAIFKLFLILFGTNDFYALNLQRIITHPLCVLIYKEVARE